jgi:GMP synthase (glutamine-hydrolysing)
VGIKPIIVECKKEMIILLSGVRDPEEKRKIIGRHYIEVFERELDKLEEKGIKPAFLMQGTIYSDVIESKGTKHAAKIKSHHNVGGLPKHMRMKLLEPVREFYKDEVRAIGAKLGLPKEFIWKQTFPGPGYAIRIRGVVNEKRLSQEIKADGIILEELKKANLLDKVYMSFPIMTDAYSTAVKGDGRSFSEVVALRIIESRDVMTTTWARIPYDVLQNISSRIVNEVPDVSRVVFDITTKPPATMEWE